MTQVREVMTAQVIAVDRLTSYREIARLLASHRISGLPVVMADRRVAGVISGTDLLASRDKAAWQAHTAAATGRRWHGMGRHPAAVAGELMTAPASASRGDDRDGPASVAEHGMLDRTDGGARARITTGYSWLPTRTARSARRQV